MSKTGGFTRDAETGHLLAGGQINENVRGKNRRQSFSLQNREKSREQKEGADEVLPKGIEYSNPKKPWKENIGRRGTSGKSS